MKRTFHGITSLQTPSGDKIDMGHAGIDPLGHVVADVPGQRLIRRRQGGSVSYVSVTSGATPSEPKASEPPKGKKPPGKKKNSHLKIVKAHKP